MAMFVASAAVDVTHGETLAKPKRRDDEIVSVQHYCPDCWVRLFTEFPSRPELVSVRPGTLDDTSWIKPNVQLWTKRAQPWLQNLPLKAFDEEPDDVKAFAWSYHDSL